MAHLPPKMGRDDHRFLVACIHFVSVEIFNFPDARLRRGILQQFAKRGVAPFPFPDSRSP